MTAPRTRERGRQADEHTARHGVERSADASEQETAPNGSTGSISDRQERERELRERIALAIQPVITNFEQQLAQAVEQRVAHVPIDAAQEQDTNERPEPPESTAADEDDGVPADDQTSQSDEESHSPARSDDAAPSNDSGPDREASGSQSQDGFGLGKLVHALERQSGDWAESSVAGILGALFSDTVRSTVRKQLDESVGLLAADIIGGITNDDESRAELEERTEKLLRSLLDDLLSEIFEGSVRKEVAFHAEEAAAALGHLDIDVAVHHVQKGLQTLLLEIVKALGRHSGEVLKLLLKVVVEYFQETVSTSVSDGFSSAVNIVESGAEAEEKGEHVKEQFKEKTEELGDKLREASQTLRERIEESSDELRTRLQNRDSDRDSGRVGRPPAGRQLGRAPGGRPPAGSVRSNRR